MRNAKFWATEESSFVVLRALAMLGGMVAILLVPHPPSINPSSAAWPGDSSRTRSDSSRRSGLSRRGCAQSCSPACASISCSWRSSCGSVAVSRVTFYLLFYLLVALVSAQYAPGIGLVTAAAAGGLYAVAGLGPHRRGRLASLGRARGHILPSRRVVGYLSQRERLARSRAEALNRDLQENQQRLEQAYGELQAAQVRLGAVGAVGHHRTDVRQGVPA